MDKTVVEIAPQQPLPAEGLERAGSADRAAAEAVRHDTRTNVRDFGLIMLIAFALMALFNSDGLRSFARDLPPSPFADGLVRRADQWHETMVVLGTAEVRDEVREFFERVRAVRW